MDAFFFKMQKSAFNERVVVGRDVVNGWILFLAVIGAANANDGDVHIGKQRFNGGVVIVGDDAVSQPLFDVFDSCAEIFLNEDIPLGLRRLQIFADAFNHLTVEGFVGVE